MEIFGGESKRVVSIFGFCSLKRMDKLITQLETGVMGFINQVAELVHEEVYTHCGSPNKNIGEAFLLVWKFPPQDEAEPTHTATADLALISFIKIFAKLHKYKHIQDYRLLGNGINITMGFGLHAGWAIEGPIGSDLKIDVSYLSPNVNIAS